jgi:hypothetical protein
MFFCCTKKKTNFSNMDSNFENGTTELGLDSITIEERKLEAEQRMQNQNQFAYKSIYF